VSLSLDLRTTAASFGHCGGRSRLERGIRGHFGGSGSRSCHFFHWSSHFRSFLSFRLDLFLDGLLRRDDNKLSAFLRLRLSLFKGLSFPTPGMMDSGHH